MTITELVAMAQRIHDAEGVHLGASSSRDNRNAFWARVIGCAYHGHPVYNSTPDTQWHLKSAGGGRPQSDDVAVSMPSRAYWDCIGGVGADGYTFSATGHAEPLPAGQEVYPPPVPAGSTSGGGTGGGGGDTGTAVCRFQVWDVAPILARLDALERAVQALSDTTVGAEVAALEASAAVKDLTRALQMPGLQVDASARVIGPIRGTVRLPSGGAV